jgi:cytochrome c556
MQAAADAGDRERSHIRHHRENEMIRIVIAAAALAIGVQVAVPQNLDVIKERQQTMKDTGAAAGAAFKMLKGQSPFDLAAAQASLRTFVSTAKKMPGLFPNDAKSGGGTKALPEAWADKSDLDARFTRLEQDATQALATITDEASFAATFPDVLKNCGGCHEKYRVRQD